MKELYLINQDSDKGYINNNLYYILGFNTSLGTIIFDDEIIYLIFDARYFDQVKNIKKQRIEKILGTKINIKYILLENNLEEIFKNILENKILIVEENIPLYFFRKLEKIKNIKIKTKENIFEEKRLIKTPEELKKIKKAINIINKVFLEIYKIKETFIGKTEYDLRIIIIQLIMKFGGEKESFSSVVAFGKNSSIPHHNTGKTKIGNGVLLIDMGAKYNGYLSDFTRTFWIGEKNKNYNGFYKVGKIVKKAHDLGIKYVKENIKNNIEIYGKDVDRVVRNYIIDRGYGEYFTHSTGHGVGLDIHEKPWISKTKGDTLIKKGMVFTIEPGIYLKNKFGFRWENIIII